ncbi:hypothetical protein KIW84_061071 [Lathyrus oleraceus]|uniref:Uncharacterized protein n=1 Tax=Pisum sativum TaxID=3888 RepID=A0A9D5A669_PEA|nr:hypothetical protein KIW84_061071 [Pisum sativum]
MDEHYDKMFEESLMHEQGFQKKELDEMYNKKLEERLAQERELCKKELNKLYANLSKAMIGTSRLQRGLYVLDSAPQPSAYNSIANDAWPENVYSLVTRMPQKETDTPAGPVDSTTSPLSNIQHPEPINSSSHSPIHDTEMYSPVDNNQSAQPFPNSYNPISSNPPAALANNTLPPTILTDNPNHIQPMRQSNRISHPPSYLADYHC